MPSQFDGLNTDQEIKLLQRMVERERAWHAALQKLADEHDRVYDDKRNMWVPRCDLQ